MSIRRRVEVGKKTGVAPWMVDIHINGARQRRTFDGKLSRAAVGKMAKEWTDQLEALAREGKTLKRGAFSIRDLADRYWNEHARLFASHATERSNIKHIAMALGEDTDLQTINMRVLSSVVGSWRGTITDNSVNHRLACLQRMWRRAEDVWEMQLPRIVWSRLKLFVGKHGDQSIRHDDRERFLAALPPRTRSLMQFALLTGLRRGGILRIEGKDIDWGTRVINTVSKGRGGGAPTPVLITPAIEQLLREMGVPATGKLFPISPVEVEADFRRARKQTGLHIILRNTRHSFAQDLQDSGNGDSITPALHHSSPEMRKRYAQARMEQVREAVERSQKWAQDQTRRSAS